jgi:hypothetical protein
MLKSAEMRAILRDYSSDYWARTDALTNFLANIRIVLRHF